MKALLLLLLSRAVLARIDPDSIETDFITTRRYDKKELKLVMSDEVRFFVHGNASIVNQPLSSLSYSSSLKMTGNLDLDKTPSLKQ